MSKICKHFKHKAGKSDYRTLCGAKVNENCVSTASLVTCQKCRRQLNYIGVSRMKYSGML